MRRKLISYDTFNRINQDSLSNAAFELEEAANFLSDALDTGSLQLSVFDINSVYYETADGNYLRADYELNDGKIAFKNIEEVIIDEASHKEARHKIINDMLEAVIEDDKLKATDLFRNLVEVSAPKMKYMKGCRGKSAVEKMASNMKESTEVWGTGSKDVKRSEAAKKAHQNNPGAVKKGWKTRRKHKSKIAAKHRSPEWQAAEKKAKHYKEGGYKAARVKGHRYGEWEVVANNVLEYATFHTDAPARASILVENDNFDNVKSIEIPVSKVRNEGKLLALKYDTLKTDVKVLREQAQRLAIDENFQKSLLDIKRSNNLSDNENLEEAINTLVSNFPSVLYLTQEELAKTVSTALEQAGATNYDDQTCAFIAEGILRVAFDSYPERVAKLASLASANLHSATTNEEDQYTVFQNAVVKFFPTVDESVDIEMQVFADLHEVFTDVKAAAVETRSEILHKHASEYLNRFEQVLNGEARPSLSLAEEAAAYLVMLGEGALDMKPWEVVKKPYRTTSGEHPDMAKKAAQTYAPKDGEGKWGDVAPVSDGKNYGKKDAEEMRHHSWAQKGGSDVYPSLNNPVVPKAGNFTMPKEKGVDKECDSALGQWQSSDTDPVIKNPYLPASVKVHVSSDDRVDN